MKVIGYRASSFKAQDTGKTISGMNIYVVDEVDPKYGVGQSCERIYLSDKKMDDIGYRPTVGDEIKVYYNRYGKVDDIEVIG